MRRTPTLLPGQVRGLAYGLGLLVGVAVVAWLIPLGTVFPADPLHAAAIGDRAQSIIGQRYVLAEPWGWPPLWAPRLDWPTGLSVAFTDSLPLVLLPLKLVRAWLPPGFYVQDGWVALAWVLQPVAAVFALRGAGERGLLPACCVALLSLSLPSLLTRYGQMSLCTHAILLGALGLYFRIVRAGGAGWAVVGSLLLLASVLVHPYLTAMAAGVLAGVPLSLLARGERRWLAAIVWFAGSIAVTAGFALALGFGGSDPAGGFGVYSMNLLAPVVPVQSSLFGSVRFDPTGGQALEGYQYLGAGVLLLALASLLLVAAGRARLPWRRHAGLVAVVVAMAVFALSNQVYAGNQLLFGFHHVPAAIQQFRATGRFFWPASYVIILASLAAVRQGLRARWAGLLLLLATGLQWVDATDLRTGVWQAARLQRSWGIDLAAWSPLLAAHDRLTLWPSFGCTSHAEPDPVFMQLLLLGSQTLVRSNTMYAARLPAGGADCGALATLGAPLQPGELRVLLPYAPRSSRWLVPGADRVCAPLAGLTVCATDVPGAEPESQPQFPLGRPVTVADDDAALAFLQGWSVPGPGGVWSQGGQAVLGVHLAAAERGSMALTLTGRGLAARPGQQQHIGLRANGQTLAQWNVGDLQPATLRAVIPGGQTGDLTLQLDIAQPIRPVDRGMNSDTRPLGFELHSIELDPQ